VVVGHIPLDSIDLVISCLNPVERPRKPNGHVTVVDSKADCFSVVDGDVDCGLLSVVVLWIRPKPANLVSRSDAFVRWVFDGPREVVQLGLCLSQFVFVFTEPSKVPIVDVGLNDGLCDSRLELNVFVRVEKVVPR